MWLRMLPLEPKNQIQPKNMPILSPDYSPSWPWFRNKHFATIATTQFRSVTLPRPFQRIRLTTPDDDFIDLDITQNEHPRLVVILHGFEGSSQSSYVRGITRHLSIHDWDVVAINYRGCSGEPNRTSRAYHAGEIVDLAHSIDHLLQTRNYQEIALVGYSLGGNVLLNYLARHRPLPAQVIAGVAISVPIDLRTAVFEIMKPGHEVYHRNFYRKIMRKMKEKQRVYPDLLPYQDIFKARDIDEIDEIYTAPFHGFENAAHYRERSSALFMLDQIQRPVLLLNALDDPFLTPTNFPYEIAETSPYLSLLTPRYGGHCGFWMKGGVYYHESKARWFIEQYSNGEKQM